MSPLGSDRFTICGESGGRIFRVGWISLSRRDSGTSVGLCDRALMVRDFEAKKFLWNAYHRQTTHFSASDAPLAMRSVLNPHMTFHPPARLHLTEGHGGKKPFQAFADIPTALTQQTVVPWIRFVSKPLRALGQIAASQVTAPSFIKIEVPSPDRSMAINVDFVALGSAPVPANDLLFSKIFTFDVYAIRIDVRSVPGQQAILGWMHQD